MADKYVLKKRKKYHQFMAIVGKINKKWTVQRTDPFSEYYSILESLQTHMLPSVW